MKKQLRIVLTFLLVAAFFITAEIIPQITNHLTDQKTTIPLRFHMVPLRLHPPKSICLTKSVSLLFHPKRSLSRKF